MFSKHRTRREFIRDISALTASAALAPVLIPASAGAPAGEFPSRSKVVLARDDALRSSDGDLNQERLSRVVNDLVREVTGLGSAKEAWSSLFTPEDVVGLKVNCLAGRGLSTTPELVRAVVSGLTQAGVAEDRIVIWDRTDRDLKKAGYRIRTGGGGLRCFGTDALREGYEKEPRIFGSVGSCFSRILTEHCTAIVNLPVLKDHDLAGVTLGMKNFYGAIHNPNKYHDNHSNPYVADLFSAFPIQKKLRLTLLDATTGLCHGGPSFKPQWAWSYNGILASKDTVALDRIGAGIIERKRSEMGLPSLDEAKRPPAYIQSADQLGLGQGKDERIHLVRI